MKEGGGISEEHVHLTRRQTPQCADGGGRGLGVGGGVKVHKAGGNGDFYNSLHNKNIVTKKNNFGKCIL